MNIHEYQAKAILKKFGVPVPNGIAAFTPEEAKQAANAYIEKEKNWVYEGQYKTENGVS